MKNTHARVHFTNIICTFVAMNFIVIIPARYASTRFPGKPLATLKGKSVIQRVYSQVAQFQAHDSRLKAVYVATDDDRIYKHVLSFGGKAIMTRPDHQSGTDRIEEAMTHIEEQGVTCDVVINVQGDEPFIQPQQIEQLCHCFDDNQTEIATLAIPFGNSDISNANSPKIVCDINGFALYFSRSAIPFVRGKEASEWPAAFPYLKHIGMYAYRREVLRQITKLPQSPLELAESLEQLRWLQNGYKIKVAQTDIQTVGIDTPEDLRRAEELCID